MPGKTDIALVGAGRLGAALALELTRAKYRVREIVVRQNPPTRMARALARAADARIATYKSARLDTALVWLCVPDREIPGVARRLAASALWKGKAVFHSSGALTSDQLAILRRRGAAVASVHPLMTFVKGAVPQLEGVLFGVEGDSAAVQLARKIVHNLGGETFPLAKERKAAYHAWGTFASPLLLSLLATAEEVARRAGVPKERARKSILPIARQTLENYARLGSASAFSGPIVRGDVATVQKHLRALARFPEGKAVYIALAQAALRFLPAKQQKALRIILGGRRRG